VPLFLNNILTPPHFYLTPLLSVIAEAVGKVTKEREVEGGKGSGGSGRRRGRQRPLRMQKKRELMEATKEAEGSYHLLIAD